MKRLVVLTLLLLTACEQAPAPMPALRLSEVLGGDNTAGFLRAEQPREFSFPADHGPHPGFRNEWWYVTGNVETAEGRRFGYQVTFFNVDLNNEDTTSRASAWHSSHLWMAHLALTDAESGRHVAVERFSRANPGLAGATPSPFRVWLENWQLASVNNDNESPWRVQAADSEIALDLQLLPLKPPVLQGDAGLSRKSEAAGNASYYYSMTRLQTTGTVRIGAEEFAVTGNSWLDREWSTSALAADQKGWDWFSLQFHDGQELMYYQLLNSEGNPDTNSHGNWTDAQAVQTPVTRDQLVLQPLKQWTGPDGVDYPIQWAVQYGDQRWRVEALVDDQFMSLSLPYWEGAVRVVDAMTGTEVGRGFLEMVRQ
ncbi:MAG: lipocalin-like domain-containing protein [Pseudomonadota bacterium]